MKKYKILTVLVVISVMMFASCKKDTSSSSSTLRIKAQATNSTFSVLKSASLAAPSFAWDTCFINVSKIDFEAEKKEGEDSHDSASIDYEWKGAKKVDLFNVNSVVGEINLQPGVYDEISLEIKALKADAGTSPVFYLSGTYTNASGVVIPIKVVVNEDIEFKAEAEGGTTLNAVNNYTSLINLNLALLMNGILQSDLDSVILTNGKIVISSTSNVLLYAKIKGNFDSCDHTEFDKD
ncbi:MAG: DUF4382 domain-containing protein [Bacteroidetes bacterium]|nr:DUF4382 domain-containing protein [Bacteroidota bacterium]MCL6102699.1 DUF4382 domain-containing protein [Bacteroidota bacterium]